MQWTELSESVRQLSWRDGGIKEQNPNIPWKDLETIKDLFHTDSVNGNPKLLAEILKAFKKDLPELLKRFKDIVQIEKTKVHPLFEKISFKKDTNTQALRLPWIRIPIELIRDIQHCHQLNDLLNKLAQCNPQQKKGKAAILVIVQTMGEIIKEISLSSKYACKDMPYRQLKEIRNKISHAWDTKSGSEFLLDLIASVQSDALFFSIKQDLLSLEKTVAIMSNDLKKRYEFFLQNPEKVLVISMTQPTYLRPYLPGCVIDPSSQIYIAAVKKY